MKKNYRYVFLRFAIAVAVFVSVVAISGMFLGCRTVKRKDASVVITTSVVHDTVMLLGERTDSFYRERLVRDTVLGIEGSEINFIADTLFMHDTVIRNGNVRLAIHGRSIDCSVDSLTLVVTRLIKDSVSQSSTNDSLYYESERRYYALQDYKYKSETTATPRLRIWLNYLLAAIAGILVWEAVKYVRRLWVAVLS